MNVAKRLKSNFENGLCHLGVKIEIIRSVGRKPFI